MEIVGVVVWRSKVLRMKKHLPFCKNPACFVFKIELLLTVLSKFEREAVLKDSAF